MTIYDQIAVKIIKEQELLMGPVAWFEAGKVEGLHINDTRKGAVSIEEKNGEIVVNSLVDRFGNIFGRAGREVCKEAVSALVADLEPSKVPSSLK
jgi:hypothetical protein